MTRRTCHEDAFAVVRIDHHPDAPYTPPEPDGPYMGFGDYSVTVKEIVLTADEPQSEVDRLNALNSDKDCRYYWQVTRYFPDGGSFGAEGML